MKLFLAIVAFVVAVIVAPLFFLSDKPAPGGQENLPWQIEVLPDGHSRVFGLELGRATMEDARKRFGPDIELAIIRAPGESGSLEAYNSSATLGFVTGKLIFAAAVSPQEIDAMAGRAAKVEYMESTTRKITLDGRDRARAWAAPIRTISFIPSVNLDEATVVERFGTPAERIPRGEQGLHLLYPEKGLDVILATKGKEVLQYVAPQDFALLRAPLVAAPKAPAPAAVPSPAR